MRSGFTLSSHSVTSTRSVVDLWYTVCRKSVPLVVALSTTVAVCQRCWGCCRWGGGAQKSGIATSQTLVDHFTKPGGWDYSRLVWLPNEVCVTTA